VKKRILSVGVAVAALVAVAGGFSQAQQPPAAAAPTVLPANRTYTVTLVTGDVVTVHSRQSGCPSVSVRLAEPGGGYRTSCGPDGHLRVVPSGAGRLVGRVLDEDLFDVTTLIQEGYDDASSTEIPLIVRAGTATTTNRAAGFAQQRDLPSIGAVAGRQPKSTTTEFVEALAVPAARAATEGPSVWLDHRVQASQETTTQLDANLRQVKAPQAWAAGHTGAGVRVAVLDTGVDPTHPDLAGKIVEQADFTVEGGDAGDRYGHGTHVAATVAGIGAGSGGARRGVAPDAQLVIGKVLNDEGRGTESQVIAGMEWAAQRAKVVNLSLGAGPSDGTDAMSQAIEMLTQQHGTLFVAASGNEGPAEATVNTPAAAPSALAVGAVDADDALADFSSRGPVAGSRALKPEIVAPGVDIVAARAAGTTMGEPIDARYTKASGTSMATPHVAGAAAVLAQVHPDWDAQKLKAALVGATDKASGGDPYELGAGRLNIAKAVAPVVSETGVVNLGTIAYPQSGTAETKVGWANTGNRPVKLTLDVRVADRYGQSTVDPAVTLAETTVTVPATSATSAVLRLDNARLRPGLYTAMITARWTGGSAITPVSFYVEPPSYDLTVTATPPPDASPDSEIWALVNVTNIDDPALFYDEELIEPGTVARLRVPAGRYSVMGAVEEVGPANESLGFATAGDPDVAVAADTSVALDGAAAKPVTATVDGLDTEQTLTSVAFLQHPRRGNLWGQAWFVYPEFEPESQVYAAPTENVGIGSFTGYQGFVLDTPDGATHYDLYRKFPDRIPAEPAYRVTAAEHARLARIDQRFNTVDAPGGGTNQHRLGWTDDGLAIVDSYYGDPPPTRVDYVTPDGVWEESGGSVLGYAFVAPPRQYAAGSRQEQVWARQPLRPDWYDGGASLSWCQPAPVRRTSALLRVALTEVTDQHDRFTCLNDDEYPPEWADNIKRTMTLYRDGQQVDTHANSVAEFPMARQAATYRLTYDQDASAALPVSTKVSTAWTFRSSAPSGTSNAPVPLLSVDYALPLDQNNHPTTGEAEFTVHQAPGTTTQKVTGFTAWTSTDDGTTWTPVTVRRVAANRFAAQLPAASAGQAVSLRVATTADGGSAMEQTIIRAYR
jgi:subtilisin family serine protease